MHTELETKFLDIDPDALRKKLRNIGAWARVRDEGDKITMSYKRLIDRTLHGTKELTVTVSDFTEACGLLTALGLEAKSYQETKRESWMLAGAEIAIDTWPWIPPFVELEAPSETMLRPTAERLGFDWSAALYGSVETAYRAHYDVTEQEIARWERITFAPVPDWLTARRLPEGHHSR
ncbi:MAG: CYTH domain-containing protein [bacterium]|nr:CYTH domain-containing protein [bacterium]MDZ4296611.1 CYTH domain-containing protein [Patescibacteria group bacterium]